MNNMLIARFVWRATIRGKKRREALQSDLYLSSLKQFLVWVWFSSSAEGAVHSFDRV